MQSALPLWSHHSPVVVGAILGEDMGACEIDTIYTYLDRWVCLRMLGYHFKFSVPHVEDSIALLNAYTSVCCLGVCHWYITGFHCNKSNGVLTFCIFLFLVKNDLNILLFFVNSVDFSGYMLANSNWVYFFPKWMKQLIFCFVDSSFSVLCLFCCMCAM